MLKIIKNRLKYIIVSLTFTLLLIGGVILLQASLSKRSPPSDIAPLPAEEVITFAGRGWGHGVGMCQYGAEGRAKAGKNYKEILGFYYTGAEITKTDKPQKVLRVDLLRGLNAGKITSTGDFEVVDRFGNRIGISKADQIWTATPDGTGRITVKDSTGQSMGKYISPIIFKPYPVTGNSILKVVNNNQRYRGFIVIRLHGLNSLRIINNIVLEDYVGGIDEVPADWNMETLKAQAIAARSYAISRIGSKSRLGFDLYSGQEDQVYVGYEREVSKNGSRWLKAASQTSGKILMHNGEIVSAYYHSTSGGSTENVEDVWETHEPAEYLRAKTDEFCKESPKYRWKVKFGVRELEEKLNSSPDTRIKGRLVELKVLSRIKGRRVYDISAYGTGGRRDIKGSDIRQILNLNSTWFDIIKEEGKS